MKKLRIVSPLLLGVLLVLSLALAGCPPVEEQPVVEVPTDAEIVADAAMIYFAVLPDDKELVREDAFVERVKAGEDMFILDIRRAEDFAAGHVIGAVNLPGFSVLVNLDRLPADETIYLYCYSGQSTGQIVALLNIAGFDAKSVRFGFVRGISTIENHEEIVTTVPADWPEVTKLEIEPAVEVAIKDYYAALAIAEIARNRISAEDAYNLLGDPDTIFLSIRRAEDYAAKHIPGAINIPFGRGMQAEFDELPADKLIIVYCYSGQTSNQTVAVLRLLGFNAVSLDNGMGVPMTYPRGWYFEGFPTTSL
ncbi:rhodanese-like domain-containing protein [Dehalococcoidia bacterium]|nr:rhodanese-like domain-containing protein [Dehalococcoidia bacterium]MCL0069769.1 rhodanese-like domain-containing protein [Dehalococcoidia bacterium]